MKNHHCIPGSGAERRDIGIREVRKSDGGDAPRWANIAGLPIDCSARGLPYGRFPRHLGPYLTHVRNIVTAGGFRRLGWMIIGDAHSIVLGFRLVSLPETSRLNVGLSFRFRRATRVMVVEPNLIRTPRHGILGGRTDRAMRRSGSRSPNGGPCRGPDAIRAH